MTFPLFNYAAIQPQKLSFPDIIGKVLEGYNQGTQSQFLRPNLEQALQKSKLFNQYYGPNMESEIGLRSAQTGEAGARTGLLGEQTKGAHIENQWLPDKMKALISESQSKTLKNQMLQQLLGGGQNQSNGQQNPMQMFQGQGMPRAPEQNQQLQQGQSPFAQQGDQSNQSAPSSGLNYPQIASAMQLLGLGHPQIVNANGKFMAVTPFGNIDTGVSGLSARGKQLAVEDAKKISALEDKALAGYQKLDTFGELNKDLGSKEFEALRQNPILGKHEIGWFEKFGTKEQQEMIGRVKTNMGKIIADAAGDFKGQFRIGEQALLNETKPGVGDSLSVMKGKSEALTYLTTMMTKRAELEADLMRDFNMSALKARIAVNKEIDPESIKKEVHTILHPASSPTITIEEAKAELERRKASRG